MYVVKKTDSQEVVAMASSFKDASALVHPSEKEPIGTFYIENLKKNDISKING